MLVDGRPNRLTHRVVWALVRSESIDGLDLHHVCHERASACPGGAACQHRRCCNPEHLAVLTAAEHTAEHEAARRADVCAKGHPFDDANTGWRKMRNGSLARVCRRCKADREFARRQAMTPAQRKAHNDQTSDCRRRRRARAS